MGGEIPDHGENGRRKVRVQVASIRISGCADRDAKVRTTSPLGLGQGKATTSWAPLTSHTVKSQLEEAAGGG